MIGTQSFLSQGCTHKTGEEKVMSTAQEKKDSRRLGIVRYQVSTGLLHPKAILPAS